MDKKYVIDESTLTGIANALRIKEDSNETIATVNFAERIEAIEPSIEDYMRVSDYLGYPKKVNELNYTKEEVEHCTELYMFYLGMEE
jgi:hypothetical protein